eukprot:931570-Pelagomonas_calceolata.AAC.7
MNRKKATAANMLVCIKEGKAPYLASWQGSNALAALNMRRWVRACLDTTPEWVWHLFVTLSLCLASAQVPDDLWFAANSETVVHDPRWPKASLRVDLRPASIAAAAAAAGSEGAAAAAGHSTGAAPGGTSSGGSAAPATGFAAAAYSVPDAEHHHQQQQHHHHHHEQQQQQQLLLCSEHLGLLLRALLQLRFAEPAHAVPRNNPTAAPNSAAARSASEGGGTASLGGTATAYGGANSVSGRVQEGGPAADGSIEGSDGRCVRKARSRLVLPLQSLVLHDHHRCSGDRSDGQGGAGLHTAAAGAAATAGPGAQSLEARSVDGAGNADEDDGSPVVTDKLLDNELLWRLMQLSDSVRLRHLELCHCTGLTVCE